MTDEFFKIIGIIIFICILIYLAVKSMKIQTSIIEGLTNPDNNTQTNSLTQNTASGASSYSDKIEKSFLQLRDSLNIQKYRSDYENVIINMNDYLGSLMLQQVLNINADGLNEENILLMIDKINKMNSGKQSLNSLMKYIDGVN
jgi:hypothetical protein